MKRSGDRLSADLDQRLKLEILRIAAAEQPLSVRALYYRCVISAILDFITKDHGNDRRNERLVQSRCLSLRREGLLPWEWIVDPSRSSYAVARYESPTDFAEIAPLYYSRDFWAGQNYRPIVVVEKVAALGTVLDHCRSFGVDVVATKGYGSASQLKDLAEQIAPFIEAGQIIVALVLADFDPSGCDWPRAAEVEVKEHLERLGYSEDDIEFQRILMTQEQAAYLGQQVALRPPNEADARTKAWLELYGFAPDEETVVELDAAAPSEVRRLLTQSFEDLFDGDLQDERNAQAADRDRIREALASLTDA